MCCQTPIALTGIPMTQRVATISEAEFVDLRFPGEPDHTAAHTAKIKECGAEFWRGDEDTMPRVAPYPFAREEVIYVIEGAVDIEFENGEKYSLKAGDVGAFAKDSPSTWTFTFPFAKLSVFPDE